MKMPIRPQTGMKIPKNWFRDLYDYVAAMTTIRGDKKNITVTQTPSGQVIRFIGRGGGSGGGSAGGSAAGYQGYFTLVDASDDDGPKVKVTDPRVEDGAAVDMLCKVNASSFHLQEWTSNVLTGGTTWIYLHFNAGSEASGTVGTPGYTPAVAASVVIEASDEELYDEGPHVYYQLGRVKYNSGEIAIYQDHCSGVPQMLWISSWCHGDDDEEEEE